jgi:hypothetical protein
MHDAGKVLEKLVGVGMIAILAIPIYAVGRIRASASGQHPHVPLLESPFPLDLKTYRGLVDKNHSAILNPLQHQIVERHQDKAQADNPLREQLSGDLNIIAREDLRDSVQGEVIGELHGHDFGKKALVGTGARKDA